MKDTTPALWSALMHPVGASRKAAARQRRKLRRRDRRTWKYNSR